MSEGDRKAATAVVSRIRDALRLLLAFPRLGHQGSMAGTHEWVVRGLPYIIIYEVNHEADVLNVLAVLHGAQRR